MRRGTRGENWFDASWNSRSETENAIPAKPIVAPATAASSARALSTVEPKTAGNLTARFVSERSSWRLPCAAAMAANVYIVGT